MKRLFKVFRKSDGTEVADIIVASVDRPEFISDTYYLMLAQDIPGDLSSLKEYYKSEVNIFAGEVRARFLYEGFGQELTYLEREKEALAWNAAGQTGDPDDYPFIHKIATATGYAVNVIANQIVARATTWRDTGSLIEAQRERAMKEIDEATDAVIAKDVRDFAVSSLDQHRP